MSQKAFSKRVEKKTYLKSPLLYVHIGRVADQVNIGGKGKIKITTSIVPTLIITMEKQNPLILTAILVHHGKATGGHYTAYLNCNGLWYAYNDMGYKSLSLIGDYNEMLKNEGDIILKNATDYFYM